MSVLVFIDQLNGNIKKASLEAANYAAQVAKKAGEDCVAVFLGSSTPENLSVLGEYGVSKVLHANDERFNAFDSKVYTKAIAEAATKEGAHLVVLAFNQNGKQLGARIAVRMEAGYVPGATTLPDADFRVRKSVFSGKATAEYAFKTEKKVIALTPNSIGIEKMDGTADVASFEPTVSDSDFSIKVRSVETVKGEIPLTEAELVVSAGRGLKGPENWGMIEELATEMGAATACSRPVADSDWRPHHEHVGQTGVTVRPNLYIAIGISGAIQHLAGVNQSKTIVVVNNDPEAPFFKAADYGVVGDAFEVVPKLIEAYKKHKASH